LSICEQDNSKLRGNFYEIYRIYGISKFKLFIHNKHMHILLTGDVAEVCTVPSALTTRGAGVPPCILTN